MMQRLGKHWKRIHRLIYVIAVLGILHYLWLVKSDLRLPIIYSIILIVLLIIRLSYIQGVKYKSNCLTRNGKFPK